MQWMSKQTSDMVLPDHTKLSRSFSLHIWHIIPPGEMLSECCCTRTVLNSIQIEEQNHRLLCVFLQKYTSQIPYSITHCLSCTISQLASIMVNSKTSLFYTCSLPQLCAACTQNSINCSQFTMKIK